MLTFLLYMVSRAAKNGVGQVDPLEACTKDRLNYFVISTPDQPTITGKQKRGECLIWWLLIVEMQNVDLLGLLALYILLLYIVQSLAEVLTISMFSNSPSLSIAITLE